MNTVDALNTADAGISHNARATPRVSTQRSAAASVPDDRAHQGEWERHSGWRPVLAAMRMAPCVASSRAVRVRDVQTPETSHDKPHEASCHGATNEVDSDCTSSKKTLAPGGVVGPGSNLLDPGAKRLPLILIGHGDAHQDQGGIAVAVSTTISSDDYKLIRFLYCQILPAENILIPRLLG